MQTEPTEVRTILAFGDSLTWGTCPETATRHPYDMRWPTVLGKGLGDGVRVIAEGLGGRTTVFDDNSRSFDANGLRALPMLLASHAPLDLVVIMLGTNDLKRYLAGCAEGAITGIERLVEVCEGMPVSSRFASRPGVMIVSPPLLCQPSHGGPIPQGRSMAEAARLAEGYRQVAERHGCGFFDAASVVTASPADGVHLTAADTQKLGLALVGPVRAMLKW